MHGQKLPFCSPQQQNKGEKKEKKKKKKKKKKNTFAAATFSFSLLAMMVTRSTPLRSETVKLPIAQFGNCGLSLFQSFSSFFEF
jgi:hypothetical protein